MNHASQLFLSAILFSSLFVSARNKEPLLQTQREIDRPLIAPKGMRTLKPSFSFSFYEYEQGLNIKGFNPINCILPPFSISYSDSFAVTYTPLPKFHFLLLSNMEKLDDRIRINGPNLLLAAGLERIGFVYSNKKQDLNLLASVGVLGKFPLSRFFWLEIPIKIFGGTSSYVQCLCGISAGIQAGNRFSLMPEYTLDASINSANHDSFLHHTVGAKLNYVISDYMEFLLSGSYVGSRISTAGDLDDLYPQKDVELGCSLIFSWF